MASLRLKPEELAQIWEMIWNKLQENGVDYSPKLIAPTTPEEWEKIRIICTDERVDAAARECNIDLKSVLDAYGGDVAIANEKIEQNALAIADINKKDELQDAELQRLEEDKADVITNFRTEPTPIVCNDSDEAPFIDMKLYGKTTQFSTKGNQLYYFDSSKVNTGTIWDEETQILTLSTASAPQITVWGNLPKVYPEETVFTITVEKLKGKAQGVCAVALMTSSGSFASSSLDLGKTPIGKTSKTVTIDKADGGYFGFFLNNGASITEDIECRLQIELGNKFTGFEPYTGGEPSPSPAYPQKIHSSGESGSIDVNVGGKNLLDPSKLVLTQANRRYCRDKGFILNKGVTYTLSVNDICSGLYINKYQTSDSLATAYKTNKLTYTPTEDVIVWFDIYKEGGFSSEFKDQFEVGSVATPYEPFKPIQTATATTVGGLNGIGGVTDERDEIEGKDIKKFGFFKIQAETPLYDSGYPAETGYKRFSIRAFTINTEMASKIRCNILRPEEPKYTQTSNTISLLPNTVFVSMALPIDECPDIPSAKAYLLAHNCEILYPHNYGKEVVTDIPQEEVDAFKALKTYNQSTSIWTSDATTMYIKYRAETSRIVKQMARDIIKNEAIYEMGENYIKYANGQLECTGSVVAELKPEDWREPIPGIFVHDIVPSAGVSGMVFPSFFIESEPVKVFPCAGSYECVIAGTHQNNLGINKIQIMRVNAQEGQFIINWIARGRWK